MEQTTAGTTWYALLPPLPPSQPSAAGVESWVGAVSEVVAMVTAEKRGEERMRSGERRVTGEAKEQPDARIDLEVAGVQHRHGYSHNL